MVGSGARRRRHWFNERKTGSAPLLPWWRCGPLAAPPRRPIDGRASLRDRPKIREPKRRKNPHHIDNINKYRRPETRSTHDSANAAGSENWRRQFKDDDNIQVEVSVGLASLDAAPSHRHVKAEENPFPERRSAASAPSRRSMRRRGRRVLTCSDDMVAAAKKNRLLARSTGNGRCRADSKAHTLGGGGWGRGGATLTLAGRLADTHTHTRGDGDDGGDGGGGRQRHATRPAATTTGRRLAPPRRPMAAAAAGPAPSRRGPPITGLDPVGRRRRRRSTLRRRRRRRRLRHRQKTM